MKRWSRWARVALLTALLVPAAAPAQEASAFLPLDHWAIEAVRRLGVAGLGDEGIDPVTRSLTVAEVDRRLRAAAREAGPELAPIVERYRDRLAAELGGSPGTGTRVYGGATAGYGVEEGSLEPGTSTPGLEDWSGPRSRPDARGALLEARLAVDGSHVAGAASFHSLGGDAALESAYAVGVVDWVGGWLGRRPLGYRPGRGGGLVLDRIRMDGGGLFLPRPVDLPLLGPVRAETDLTRVSDNGTIGRPWLWSSRFALQPVPRLRLGITRAVMFGGDNHEPVTLRNVLNMIIGKHGSGGSGFENQVVSVDVHYRPPLPAPIELRLEWGFDDSAGAWVEQPAIVGGVELAAVPGLPILAVGLEHTYIAGAVHGHSIWYRHWRFLDGWVDRGTSLGHPLGGHGTEWLVYGTVDAVATDLRVDARVFLRDRGEDNLFSPDREGPSRGIGIDVEWGVTGIADLVIAGVWERGDSDWSRGIFRIGARMRTGTSTP